MSPSRALFSALLLPAWFALASAPEVSADDSSGIRVSETTILGDMECFKIETPHATYLYGKRGAGFALLPQRFG